MLPLMIRRPPSIIALGDEELQYHLHRTYLRSLSTDLDRLHLDDPDRDYDGDDLFGLSSADDSEEDADVKQNRKVRGSCVRARSVQGVITTSLEESALTESAHQTVDTINVPAARLGSSLLWTRQLKTTETALQDQGQSTIHPSGKEENCRNPLHAWAAGNDGHSQLPTVQIPCQLPAAIPEMDLNAVPLRGLSLASTRSDEAGLGSTASTAIAADT
ncbi:uncharacterized protein N7484_006175 [Penicillium longicatenatum]|uniref:uncharacterized protein n=1 Tax=Penicillium longicatenatum TaxID=1561947 RepID=UPI002547BB34|nr:uncharacterized protein N7484_006175 [Penicillium longicatenatum]KAJ5643668.1 hypothetical protein N7484_006175 [Penicillium longicatenatum]